VHLIYGAMRDKAIDEISGILFPRAHQVIVTAPQQARALAPEALRDIAAHPNLRTAPTLRDALALVEDASPEDVVFVTGSLFLGGRSARAAYVTLYVAPAVLRRCFYFSSALIATCEMASSTSLAAPLHATAPIILPSTWIGRPPWLGNPSGKTSTPRFPPFNESSAAFDGLPYKAAYLAFFCANWTCSASPHRPFAGTGGSRSHP